MVYLISAKEIEFYYQRQKCATRCRFFYQMKNSSTRYGICYQTQNLLPDAEFFYQMLGTQKNSTPGGVLHPHAMNAQVTLPDVGIIYQTPQMHEVFTSRPVRPGCWLLHRMEVSTSRCTVFFLMLARTLDPLNVLFFHHAFFLLDFATYIVVSYFGYLPMRGHVFSLSFHGGFGTSLFLIGQSYLY